MKKRKIRTQRRKRFLTEEIKFSKNFPHFRSFFHYSFIHSKARIFPFLVLSLFFPLIFSL